MKKLIILLISFVLLATGCAPAAGNPETTTENSGGENVTNAPETTEPVTTEPPFYIDESVLGTWYGPAGTIVLNIEADGNGTVEVDEETEPAKFTAENGVFTAESETYALSGNYTVEDDLMFVYASFGGDEAIIVFQRELPDERLTYIYEYNNKHYKIKIRPNGEGEIGETEVPEKDKNYPKNDISYYIIEGDVIICDVFPRWVYEKENEKKPEAPKIPKDVTPEKINKSNKKSTDDVKLNNGKTTTIYRTSSSIEGTWTSEIQDEGVYLNGVKIGKFEYINVYTFNADGSGQVVTLNGFLTLPISYSLDGTALDLTLYAPGQTQSGRCYAQVIGDILYVTNVKGELEMLSRVN